MPVINEVAVSVGVIGLCAAPGLEGGLERDLADIRAFAPDRILTLMETAELAALGLEHVPDALRTLGVPWHHAPIQDFSTPTQMTDWARLEPDLLAALRNGDRHLIHCRGGLGRSGMIALRLMIALGENPDTALSRLRFARPGAVETEAQRLWAVGAG